MHPRLYSTVPRMSELRLPLPKERVSQLDQEPHLKTLRRQLLRTSTCSSLDGPYCMRVVEEPAPPRGGAVQADPSLKATGFKL